MKTKLPKHEFRGHVQAERLREHARSDEHRRSLTVFLNPTSAAESLESLPDLRDSDGELFGKAVPQPQDWRAAWFACADDKSW